MRRTFISNSIILLVSLLLAGSTSAQVGTQSVQQGETVWPRSYSSANEAQIVIYQPQIASWEGNNHMVASARGCTRGDDVYAGRDGNVYRKDANGNWNKWENGSWNQVQRPDHVNPVRDGMLNESAKQREQQLRDRPSQRDAPRGERTGQSAATRQLDPSTYRSLERDRSSRVEGAQRSRDRGTYQRSGGNAGSYRSGGFSRGGGGFRGGGRRR